MENIFKAGEKVHFVDEWQPEDGIIKSVSGQYCYIVTRCNQNWKQYHNYTGQRVHCSKLKHGWNDGGNGRHN